MTPVDEEPTDPSLIEPFSDPWRQHASRPEGSRLDTKSERSSPRKRVFALMESLDIATIAGFANAAGISRFALDRVLYEDSIDEATARQIARSLHISYDWIAEGEGPAQKLGSEIQGFIGIPGDQAAGTLRAVAQSAPLISGESVLIAKAGTKLSAGGGIISEELESGNFFPFPVDFLRALGASAGRVLLIDVDGDSMSPDIRDKDTVLIDVNRTEVRDGKIYAIAVGDVVQVKQLQIVGPGRILVKSLNEAFHSYEVRFEELRVIGRIIWGSRIYS